MAVMPKRTSKGDKLIADLILECHVSLEMQRAQIQAVLLMHSD